MLFVPWIKSENKKEKTFAAANARVLAPLGRRHCHCSRDRSVSAASPAMQSVMCAPIWSVTRRLWNGFQLPFRLRVAFSDSPPFSCLLPPALSATGGQSQFLMMTAWALRSYVRMSQGLRGCGAGEEMSSVYGSGGASASAADFALGVFSQAEVDLFVSTLWWENSSHCSQATPTHLSERRKEWEREEKPVDGDFSTYFP